MGSSQNKRIDTVFAYQNKNQGKIHTHNSILGELLETVKPPPFPVHERNKQTGAKQTGAAGRGRGTLRKNAEVSGVGGG